MITVICQNCGKEFDARSRSVAIGGGKYCSRKCARQSQSKRVKCDCENCGKEFEKKSCEIKFGRKNFCSKKCHDLYRRNKVKKICPICGKEFLVKPFIIRRGDGKFCSHRCANMGENNPNWKCGVSPERLRIQSSSEYKQWRKAVYERDSYTCQKCHRIGGDLAAHHQYNFRKFPTLRTEISNGITFCEECHREFHGIFGNKKNNPNQVIQFVLKC